jgi:hypothetical protein
MKLLGTPQQQGQLLERSGRLAEGKHWHASTRATTTTERVGQWREALAPWEAALCETVLAERMTRFGDELTGAGRPPAGDFIRYVQETRTLLRRAQRLKDLWDRQFEPNPVPARLSSVRFAVGS